MPLDLGHAPGHLLLTVDAADTTDHRNAKALPGFLAFVVDTVRPARKPHRLSARSGSTVVTGHDPDTWPTFKHVSEAYD
jgi:N-acyl homoserine lactone hydrolase